MYFTKCTLTNNVKVTNENSIILWKLILLITDRVPYPSVWLAKWCKIHKVYIHSHPMLLLMFTNIFIHIQQPNLQSRNIHVFIHIYLCISYSGLYLLTFTRRLHSLSTSYIHSHSRSKYSFNIFCAPPLRIGQCKTETADWGLRTTDYGLG